MEKRRGIFAISAADRNYLRLSGEECASARVVCVVMELSPPERRRVIDLPDMVTNIGIISA